MKRQLFTLLLMVLGMASFAQSGWTDPSSEYQAQTVVYAVVDCGNYDPYAAGDAPEVAAFIDGELRAVVTNYRQMETVEDGAIRLYTLRVGGTDADKGKPITFKFFDQLSGFIYPLEVEGGESILWNGDITPVYPSNYYTLTATPAASATLFDETGNEVEKISFRVNDEISLTGYHVKFYDADENEIEVPDATGTWNIGGPNAPYVEQVATDDGSIQVRAINETPDFDGDGTPDFVESCIVYRTGSFEFFIPTQVLPAYVPVTSIAVGNVQEYWRGYGRLVLTDDVVTYNGNNSWPTYPGVKIISSSKPAVASVVGENALSFNGIGTSTITVAATENENIKTTFSLNIISALDHLETGYESLDVEYLREGEGEEDMEMAPPIFHWIEDENGSPVIGNDVDESYTVTSNDPTVLRVDETDGGYSVMSLKVGYAELTITSKYDPTKTLTYKVTVRQAVSSVEIFEINGVEITGDDTPAIDVITGNVVTAKAVLNPENAYFEEFRMNFVNANWGTIEGFEEYVEVIDSKVEGNVLTFQFRFKYVPLETYFLQADVDYDHLSDLVQLNVYPNVSGIDIAMESEYWISDGDNVFDFDCMIDPVDAYDKTLTVESSNPEVAEVILSGGGMYQLHAYTTGEVTFTFKSNTNPAVQATVTTVIKREPTGVKIVAIGGQTVNMNPAYREAISIAVGQEVEAVAQVEPNDATIESFIIQVVNANGGEIFGSDVLLTSEPTLNEEGTQCSFTFTFMDVPSETPYVKANVNDKYTDQVELRVIQSVSNIELSENEMTFWIYDGELVPFEIGVTVYPDNATNLEYTVESSDERVVSLGGNSMSEGFYNFQVEGKGTATLTFTSIDNPTVVAKCVVTVKKKVDYMVVEGLDGEIYNDGQVYNAMLSIHPYDADFDIEALTVNVINHNENSSIPGNWQLLDVEVGDEVDENGNIALVLSPRSLAQGLAVEFYYNTTAQDGYDSGMNCTTEVSIKEKLTLDAGWNWVSLLSGKYDVYELENVVEVRSKEKLVFNDPSWGLFGDLDYLYTTEAYKVKIPEEAGSVDVIVDFDNNFSAEGNIDSKQFVKGWNWVSYPYEYAYAINEVFNAQYFTEGDIIISKSRGFATLTDGAWEGTLEILKPGEGYMMYVKNPSADAIEMPNRYSLEQGYFEDRAARASSRLRSVWDYNGSRFANTMAIIGKFDIEECESYTIGAFVGEECRGEGKFINGKAYISVAGEAGETVTFRLYNEWTGEFVEVLTELEFAEMMGTAKAPVLMGTLNGTTGIVDINTIDVNNIEAIYDITGRAVSKMTKGIYVIKVREGDNVVTKKVRK